MPCSTASESHKRRAAALEKYRKKRSNLKFGKTIRYEGRKHLANSRPRVKGMFAKGTPQQSVQEDRVRHLGGGCEEEDPQTHYGGGQNFDVSSFPLLLVSRPFST